MCFARSSELDAALYKTSNAWFDVFVCRRRARSRAWLRLSRRSVRHASRCVPSPRSVVAAVRVARQMEWQDCSVSPLLHAVFIFLQLGHFPSTYSYYPPILACSVRNLYIYTHRSSRASGRKARPGDQLNTRFCIRFGGFTPIKNVLVRTEMWTRKREEWQSIRTVWDITRDDRAWIAACRLRTPTDRQTDLRRNYNIDTT